MQAERRWGIHNATQADIQAGRLTHTDRLAGRYIYIYIYIHTYIQAGRHILPGIQASGLAGTYRHIQTQADIQTA